ncbi:MAG TPA: cyclic nucleotide-binding domain-containing protein [bacterium]|nr:cyclic nucleotide-binding domain-containing protein [bacterium]
MEKLFSSGSVIVRRHEIAPFLMRIVSGKVSCEIPGRSWHLSDGDFFGDEGVLLKKPAPYTAYAAEETVITMMNETEASAFLAGDPAAALAAVRRTAARLYEPTGPLTPDNPLYLRLLKILLPHTQQQGGPDDFFPLTVTLDHLASSLDGTVESLRLLLKEATALDIVRVAEDDTIQAKSAEHLRRALSAGQSNRHPFSMETQRYGRGHFNLLSRIDPRQEGQTP